MSSQYPAGPAHPLTHSWRQAKGRNEIARCDGGYTDARGAATLSGSSSAATQTFQGDVVGPHLPIPAVIGGRRRRCRSSYGLMRLEMLWMQPIGSNSRPAAPHIDALLGHHEGGQRYQARQVLTPTP